MEYRVGPIVDGAVAPDATIKELLKPGTIPLTKRPDECGGDDALYASLRDATVRELGEATLVPLFGPVFPQFESFKSEMGTGFTFLRNDVTSNATRRVASNVWLWQPPPPARSEAS